MHVLVSWRCPWFQWKLPTAGPSAMQIPNPPMAPQPTKLDWARGRWEAPEEPSRWRPPKWTSAAGSKDQWHGWAGWDHLSYDSNGQQIGIKIKQRCKKMFKKKLQMDATAINCNPSTRNKECDFCLVGCTGSLWLNHPPASITINGNPAQNITIKQPTAWEFWAVPHLVCQAQCALHAVALVFASQSFPALVRLVGPREANAPGGDGRRGGSSRQTPPGKCRIDAPWRAQLQAACCVDRICWNKRSL